MVDWKLFCNIQTMHDQPAVIRQGPLFFLATSTMYGNHPRPILTLQPKLTVQLTLLGSISAITLSRIHKPLFHLVIDQDSDGLIDDIETLLGTNPTVADTDNDGKPDGIDLWPTNETQLETSSR